MRTLLLTLLILLAPVAAAADIIGEDGRSNGDRRSDAFWEDYERERSAAERARRERDRVAEPPVVAPEPEIDTTDDSVGYALAATVWSAILLLLYVNVTRSDRRLA